MWCKRIANNQILFTRSHRRFPHFQSSRRFFFMAAANLTPNTRVWVQNKQIVWWKTILHAPASSFIDSQLALYTPRTIYTGHIHRTYGGWRCSWSNFSSTPYLRLRNMETRITYFKNEERRLFNLLKLLCLIIAAQLRPVADRESQLVGGENKAIRK